MRRRVREGWFGVLATLMLAGCATRYSIHSDYHAAIRETPQSGGSARTVVLFLVDGLSFSVLEREYQEGRLPGLSGYFGARVHAARAVFPSMTYPNVASILTAAPVAQHRVLGNWIRVNGEEVNFESPRNFRMLNQAIAGRTIFAHLTEQGRNSVSLSQIFLSDATSSFSPDLRSRLAPGAHQVETFDALSLDNLKVLLAKTELRDWPELIFVQLAGVDSLSRQHGASSPEAMEYLRSLDARLRPILDDLRDGESKGREVVALLTSDHGFTEVEKSVDLEGAIRKAHAEIQVIDQSRFATLDFPKDWGTETRALFLRRVSRFSGVAATAWRTAGELRIESVAYSARVRYRQTACPGTGYALQLEFTRSSHGEKGTPFVCPEVLDARRFPGVDPYFWTQLAGYFHSPDRPGGLVIAAPHTSFSKGMTKARSEHGGLTSDEILVPVLARNAVFSSDGKVPFSHELLTFAGVERSRAKDHVPPLFYPATALASAEPVRRLGSSTEAGKFAGFAKLLDFQQSVEFSTPMTSSRLSLSEGPNGPGKTWNSSFNPGLRVEWKQLWAKRVSSLLSYQASLSSLGASERVLHGFRVGGNYRFGEGRNLILSTGFGQQKYPVPGGLFVKESWQPDITFETRSRVLSLGIGDIAIRGSAAVLFPVRSAETSFGFATGTALGLEQPVGTYDLVGIWANVGTLVQGGEGWGRTLWNYGLGFSYSLSFQD